MKQEPGPVRGWNPRHSGRGEVNFPRSYRALVVHDPSTGGWLPAVRGFRDGEEVERTVGAGDLFGYGTGPYTWATAANIANHLTDLAAIPWPDLLPALLSLSPRPSEPRRPSIPGNWSARSAFDTGVRAADGFRRSVAQLQTGLGEPPDGLRSIADGIRALTERPTHDARAMHERMTLDHLTTSGPNLVDGADPKEDR